MYKAYEMIINEGLDVYKVLKAEKYPKKIKQSYGGEGEIIRIKDVTESYPIDVDYLRKVLRGQTMGHFGEVETEIICSILEKCYENA